MYGIFQAVSQTTHYRSIFKKFSPLIFSSLSCQRPLFLKHYQHNSVVAGAGLFIIKQLATAAILRNKSTINWQGSHRFGKSKITSQNPLL
jgi:hypothetical protein